MKFSILKIATAIAMALPTLTTAEAQAPVAPPPPSPDEPAPLYVQAPDTKSAEQLPIFTADEVAKMNVPYGTRAKGRPGFVTSPYNAFLVDVAGCAPGTVVRCPYSQKLFRVPEPSDEEKGTSAKEASKNAKVAAIKSPSVPTPAAKPTQPTKPKEPKPATATAPKAPAVKPATPAPKDVASKPAIPAPAAKPKAKAVQPAEATETISPEPKKLEAIVRVLSKEETLMLMPLMVKDRPLAWVEQEPNKEGRQTVTVVEKRGAELVSIFERSCTTGRNSLEGGESLPTPSTFDTDGNVTAIKIVRKDKVRAVSGLEWAMEIDHRDNNGNLTGTCFHKGPQRFYPSSHGCIRMEDPDARWLFNKMEVGDPVVITGRALSDNPYVKYVDKGGKQKVPVFKIDVPEGVQPSKEDIDAFVALLRLPKGDPKKMQLDHMPNGVISADKAVVKFRFEHMPRGTGITMKRVEELTGLSMYIGPVVSRPPTKTKK